VGLFVPWLADAARMTGYPVSEVGGWRGRGHGPMSAVEGAVCHHTADGPRGDYPSMNIVTHGRAGLAGPLANYGLGRSGTVYVIAAGCAWHAGASSWAGFRDLNTRFLGIEAESTGHGDWTAEQRDCYPRLCAAICHFIRRGADRVCAHRECALPKGRKPDPTGIDMNQLRGTVAWMLGDPGARIPRGGGASLDPNAEDDMAGANGYTLPAGENMKIALRPPGRGVTGAGGTMWFSMCTGWESTGPIKLYFIKDGPWVIKDIPSMERDKVLWWEIGADVWQVSIEYSSKQNIAALIEWRRG
jgi:hypothetical protein